MIGRTLIKASLPDNEGNESRGTRQPCRIWGETIAWTVASLIPDQDQMKGIITMKRIALIAILTLLSGTPALAHAGHGVTSGFLHPFLGWDHLLAMLAVGAWGARGDHSRSSWHPPTGIAILYTRETHYLGHERAHSHTVN